MAEPVVDAVAQAIEATEQATPVAMAQRQLTISSTGRPFVFLHPVDMSESEVFEVVGWMATAFRAEQEQEQRRKQRDPAVRLWVPPAPGAPRSA